MSKSVELVFDFVSPNAYLVWWPLSDLCARHGAQLVVTPVFLAGMHRITGNAPPMIRDKDVRGKTEYAALEMERFIARHGLTKYRLHPQFPFNSVQLQRMLVAACADARGREFAEALLRAVWEEGIDIADAHALARTIAQAGFDADDLAARAQTDAVKRRLADNTDAVVERGAFGIPTMFVPAGGGRESMFFGKERLDQIAEALSA